MLFQTTIRKKIFVAIVASLFLFANVHAQVYFDSEGGVAIDALPKAGFAGADMNFKAYYGTQIQLGNDMLFEGEFSFTTANLFQDIFLQEIPGTFNLDKLSLSYQIAGRNFNSRVSIFAGTNDVIGTDDFAQKYLGALPFESSVFEKKIAENQPGILSIDGFGFEANTVFDSSFATSFYGYYNERFNAKQLNFDLRLVGLTEGSVIDFLFGSSLPFDNVDASGNTALLVIQRADLHAALSMLVGNNPYANLFLQVGTSRIQLDPPAGSSLFSFEDLHVFIEPRFSIGNVNMSLAMFYLPQYTVDLIDYIENQVGAGLNLDIETNTGTTKSNIGFHASVSYEDALMLQFDNSKLSVNVAPYIEMNEGNGQLKISVPLKVYNFSTLEEIITASVSYKTLF